MPKLFCEAGLVLAGQIRYEGQGINIRVPTTWTTSLVDDCLAHFQSYTMYREDRPLKIEVMGQLMIGSEHCSLLCNAFIHLP